MTSFYRYGLLVPVRVAGAEDVNAPLLGPHTLGIEVTEPTLAERCGLGNIDPQHGELGRVDLAAIEACLDAPLPPCDAILVTLRPDLDALGSMALLTLRAGRVPLSEGLRGRVREVAEHDRFARGPWPGPRPLPWHSAAGDSTRMSPSLCHCAAAAAADHQRPLDDRIKLLCRWLQGEGKTANAALREDLAPYAHALDTEHGRIAAAVADGRLMIEGRSENRIARVESHGVPRVATLGYCVAPVVVACDHAFRLRGGPPHRKFTVCQFTEGHVDLRGVAAELNAIEPGWGGSPTIIGSPQGVASGLAIDQVLAAVERRLRVHEEGIGRSPVVVRGSPECSDAGPPLARACLPASRRSLASLSMPPPADA